METGRLAIERNIVGRAVDGKGDIALKGHRGRGRKRRGHHINALHLDDRGVEHGTGRCDCDEICAADCHIKCVIDL